MNFDQYRLQPLPPKRKPIWKILAFGAIAIFLISLLTYAFLTSIPVPLWIFSSFPR